MGKSKRSINPADALRKAQRKRELKKNKEIRKSAREAGLAKKDTDKLRIDIGRLEGQERSGTIDKAGQTRLTQLKEELAQIEKAKKEVNKPLSKAQEALAARQQQQTHDSRKLVFDPKSGKFVPVKRKESTKKSTGKDGDQEDGGSSSDDDDSDSSMSDDDDDDDTGIIGITVEEGDEGEEEGEDEEGNQQQEQEIDQGEQMDEDIEDIPMPEGSPPAAMNSDDEIDIPLPPGPPPPQPFRNQLSAVRPQYGPFVPKTPPPPPPGPPPALRYTTMRPPPPPPPPPHLRYSSMRPPPPPPPRPPFGYIPHMQQQPIYTAPPSHFAPPRPAVPPPPPPPPISTETSKTATISAEPQLRDLQKELVGFVPAALRRKQAQTKKTDLLPKGARPNDINLAPDVE
ncbi:WW domain binding protein 11-domain-containing protein [Chlamydoabsidia padenii]|nr:WW domain binding protein 11-domain-containing protein [Chlamydoabsidia padenii]